MQFKQENNYLVKIHYETTVNSNISDVSIEILKLQQALLLTKVTKSYY